MKRKFRMFQVGYWLIGIKYKFISDSRFAVYPSNEGVSFWDIKNLTKSHSIEIRKYCYIESYAFTPDSKYLAMIITGEATFIIVYDVNTSKTIATIHQQFEVALSLILVMMARQLSAPVILELIAEDKAIRLFIVISNLLLHIKCKLITKLTHLDPPLLLLRRIKCWLYL